MNETARIVILGAGHAGGSVVAFLRQYGFKGVITLVGDEPIPPYHRPPLSKAWLKGDATAESLALRPAKFYADQQVQLRLSATATAIDPAARTVTLADGETLSYDHLILAMGARARKLTIPGADLAGVLELRTAADADRLKAAIGPGKHLAIVGGGYIGLEAAASARALGGTVTIIEREPRLLARVASEPLSAFFDAFHRAQGVAIELNAGVAALDGEDGHVTAVRLADGRAITCDAALIGVGAIANDELASAAGLVCANGIHVDLSARTSNKSIFAIGDCTQRPLHHYGRQHRLESVPNAIEQAKQAAAAITGRNPPPHEVPWFWSDQYDLKLQIAGLPFDTEQTVLRGDPMQKSFAVFHLTAAGCVQSVEAVNAAPEFMAGKMLIASRKPLLPERLADVSVSMKDLL